MTDVHAILFQPQSAEKILRRNVNGSTDRYGNVSGTYSGTANTSNSAVYATNQLIVIDAGQYVYVVSRPLRWRWSKTANVTVNSPVQYSVENRTLYVLDDNAREFKARIVKRILKNAK